jgi:hypothetical protein
MIAQKRAPQVSVDGMDRIIQKIYDDINDVINSVNQSMGESRSTAKGKEGDIRIIKDSTDNTYRMEAFTKDGWAKTELEIVKE